MKTFNLPDLGEGLPEAEIINWHVGEGDRVVADQPLVSVETAKAIVEIPSPRSGTIATLYAQQGEFVQTGDPLVGFAQDESRDSGTVVGEVKATTGQERRDPGKTLATGTSEFRGGAQNARATPAVRALARRLEVDLNMVSPSGKEGMITAEDVNRVSTILTEVGPQEPLRGARRAMARHMAQSHAEVVPVMIVDDANLHRWKDRKEILARLIQGLVAGCRAEPSLNAWFDSHALGRRLLSKIDLGIAVDSDGGLFVPVLRDVAQLTPESIRVELEVLREKVQSRTLKPEELRGASITLTNFGTMAGRYANPVVIPPTVAILGAGTIRDEVVAFDGKPAVHPILPLSLTFDHRVVTGGEAARFLAAVINHLEHP